MQESIHNELKINTEKLKDLLKHCSTKTIVGTCATMFFLDGNFGNKEINLTSKLKQVFFLLGLMLTTNEPEKPIDFSKEDWVKAQKLLEEIFFSYTFMFFPSVNEVGNVTEEWKKTREIAMPAFLHYFNMGVLASVEQVSYRIIQCLSPFDDYLLKTINIKATDALEIAKWISSILRKQVDELQRSQIAFKQLHSDFIENVDNELKKKTFDETNVTKHLQTDEAVAIATHFHNSLQNLFHISKKEIEDVFGVDKANGYWNNYVSKRGESSDYFYLTQRNLVEEKPLIEVDEGLAICPLANSAYNAIERVCVKVLSDGPQKAAYLKKRDTSLEKEVEEAFISFFGNEARTFSSSFETPQSSHEHDLILIWNKKLLVIEAKATPPLEPFRDPDKAYERIQRAFKSSSGIQKAFEQAESVRKKVSLGVSVPLYDGKGNLIYEINSNEIENQYSVCVTRDNFGVIATNLSLLLSKDDTDPYPWAINIYDLVNLLDAWKYLGWGPERLFAFIEQRIGLNGKIYASDELEIAGYFVRHDSLEKLPTSDYDVVMLNHTYSDIFDKIYAAQHGGEPFVNEIIDVPFVQDMREILEPKPVQELSYRNRGIQKQNRNERCLCGSGKKHKYCCGKLL